jgi:hypothetical protein
VAGAAAQRKLTVGTQMDYSIVRKIARDCLRLDRVDYPRSAVLSVAHDTDRSLLHEGRYYSPLIDTIEDDLRARGVECVSIARVISRIKGDRAYARVYSPEGSFARALVSKRLRASLTRSPRYPYSHREEKVWGEILDRTGARKVFGIQPSRELCVAAGRRSVWVADVQHGVISDSHPWYGERFRGDEPAEYVPRAFLCWDDASRQVMERWARAKGAEIVVTGNRWLARFLPSRDPDPLARKLLQAYPARTLNPSGKPSILVALSWGEVNIPNGFIADALCEVIQATSDRFHWSVRLHPNQLNGFATHEGRRFKEFFRRTLEGRVEWEAASRSALPAVLRSTDLHICWNSSVCLEAAQMGVRSALLDPRLRSAQQMGDYYADLRRSGLVTLLEAERGPIMNWIDTNVAAKTRAHDFADNDTAYARVLDFLAADGKP